MRKTEKKMLVRKDFRRERSRSAPNAVTRQRPTCEFSEVPCNSYGVFKPETACLDILFANSGFKYIFTKETIEVIAKQENKGITA